MTVPIRSAFAATVLLLASACGPGRDYRAPVVDAPPSWKETAPSGDANLTAWWRSFADPALDGLVAEAVAHNLDLELALSRIDEARARRGVVGWLRAPDVDAVGSATRQASSQTTQFPLGVRTTFEAGFDATWEVDLFGGLKRGIEAADADLAALAAARSDVLTTVVAETVRAYLDLATANELTAIVDADLATQRRIRDLVAARVAAGAGREAELAQAEAQLASLEAGMPDIALRRSTAATRLAVLLSRPASAAEDETMTAAAAVLRVPQPTTIFAAGLPSELVWRRPDLRRAEHEYAAAVARVGVAERNLYPRFSLTGSFGLQSEEAETLFDSRSRFWAIGPSVRWPILEQGRIRNEARAADARAHQAEIVYHRSVITAFAEVEQALAAVARAQDRVRAADTAAAAHERALRLLEVRYEGGLENILGVLSESHATALARREAVEARRTMALSVVALAKALGGGWQPRGQPAADDGRQGS
jgi:outer membrane protein, multidrug efflux system